MREAHPERKTGTRRTSWNCSYGYDEALVDVYKKKNWTKTSIQEKHHGDLAVWAWITLQKDWEKGSQPSQQFLEQHSYKCGYQRKSPPQSSTQSSNIMFLSYKAKAQLDNSERTHGINDSGRPSKSGYRPSTATYFYISLTPADFPTAVQAFDSSCCCCTISAAIVRRRRLLGFHMLMSTLRIILRSQIIEKANEPTSLSLNKMCSSSRRNWRLPPVTMKTRSREGISNRENIWRVSSSILFLFFSSCFATELTARQFRLF